MTRSAVLTLPDTRSLTNNLAFALFGSVLLWLSAKLQVPFWPVPMTMQSLVVVLLPVVFGARAGVGAVILYLIEGATGLPVFAESPQHGIGFMYMMGPTGGYLIGFVLAALAIAVMMTQVKPNFIGGIILATIGHAIIFTCGVLWLAMETGLEKAFMLGFVPFIAGSGMKIGMAACVTKLMAK